MAAGGSAPAEACIPVRPGGTLAASGARRIKPTEAPAIPASGARRIRPRLPADVSAIRRAVIAGCCSELDMRIADKLAFDAAARGSANAAAAPLGSILMRALAPPASACIFPSAKGRPRAAQSPKARSKGRACANVIRNEHAIRGLLKAFGKSMDRESSERNEVQPQRRPFHGSVTAVTINPA